MQRDLVPELAPSGPYENIVTATDVFFRQLFAYPTSNQDAKTNGKVPINMTKHAYLPATLISDKGTAFVSHVITEVAGVLGITLKHATTKHAQTIGLFERSHASIKQALMIATGVIYLFSNAFCLFPLMDFFFDFLFMFIFIVSSRE